MSICVETSQTGVIYYSLCRTLLTIRSVHFIRTNCLPERATHIQSDWPVSITSTADSGGNIKNRTYGAYSFAFSHVQLLLLLLLQLFMNINMNCHNP